MTTTTSTEAAQVREHMESLARALGAKDLDALMAHYAPDVIVYDFRPPLQVVGADAYRKNFEAWFGSVRGPIRYEMADPRIQVRGDIAFGHSLSHVQAVRTTGEPSDYWVRVTSGLQKIDGVWRVIHEHISVPIRMETMQAAMDLTP